MKKKISKKLLFCIVFCSVFLLSFIIPASYSGRLFGKCYDANKDFSCCKQNNLIIHHFYAYRFLGAQTITGYDEEIIEQKTKEACDIQCEE